MKLRTFLLAVVGLTLIPMLGVAGTAIWWAHQDERRAMEQALLYHARSLTLAVDREVETSLAGLRGLATSSDLDAPDLRRFYEQARLAREAYRRWLTVALVEPSGRQVLNLLQPLGSPLPSVADLDDLPAHAPDRRAAGLGSGHGPDRGAPGGRGHAAPAP